MSHTGSIYGAEPGLIVGMTADGGIVEGRASSKGITPSAPPEPHDAGGQGHPTHDDGRDHVERQTAAQLSEELGVVFCIRCDQHLQR